MVELDQLKSSLNAYEEPLAEMRDSCLLYTSIVYHISKNLQVFSSKLKVPFINYVCNIRFRRKGDCKTCLLYTSTLKQEITEVTSGAAKLDEKEKCVFAVINGEPVILT